LREEGDETDSITAKPPSILISPATFASDDDLTERPESTVNEPRQQEDHLDDLEVRMEGGLAVILSVSSPSSLMNVLSVA
jgi:phosphate uptake regulator